LRKKTQSPDYNTLSQCLLLLASGLHEISTKVLSLVVCCFSWCPICLRCCPLVCCGN